MQELIKVFSYEGNEVTFRTLNGITYANGTEMARNAGKLTKDWTGLKSTKAFLAALSAERRIVLSELIIISKGADQGTFLHEDVALEFARWISPKFAIWCNDRIKELVKHRATAINPEDLLNPDFIINLATALKAERSAKELAQQQVAAQTAQLQLSAPKVQYYDEVLQSESLIPVTLIAKELGMSASTLNRKLHEKRVIYKMGETWVLYDKYQNAGYTKPKTVHYTSSTGEPKTTIHTYWTEAGRCFIHKLIRK